MVRRESDRLTLPIHNVMPHVVPHLGCARAPLSKHRRAYLESVGELAGSSARGAHEDAGDRREVIRGIALFAAHQHSCKSCGVVLTTRRDRTPT